MYNQELYQQYKQNRHKKQQPLEKHAAGQMRSAMDHLPDQHIVTLENSIPLMRELGIVDQIRDVQHIVSLMENRRGGTSWEADQRQLCQCRLIYFMWHIISNDQIQMKEFKKLIKLLSTSEKDRCQTLESIYGQKQEIVELLKTWDKLIQFNSSSPKPQINDISIIKTKNEGNFGSNKENFSIDSNLYIPSNRSSLDSKSSKTTKSRVRLEKSYTKKSAKTVLDRSSSTVRANSKRSDSYSMANYLIPTQQTTFFSQSETLTPNDQKKLIDRLYDCSRYRTREQLKKQIEQERIKVELNSCSFKPQINKTLACPKQQTKEIKGFNRAIDRMKQGYQKKNQLKQNLQYRSTKELAPLMNQLTQFNPPKFHSKPVKQQKPELFELKFSLGRMSIPIKVRQSDSLEQLVDRTAKIYSLKKHQKDFIRQSILTSLDQYKQAILPSIEQTEH